MNSSQRPSPKFGWFIPIDGDGEHIGTLRPERPPTFDYLKKVAQTAEECGYDTLLIPTRFVNGLFEEHSPLAETWTTAAALVAATSRIGFLIAVRPGFINPGLFAQMASSLDNISGGRINLNVVPGGIQGEFEKFGIDIDHAERYAVAEELMIAMKQLWAAPEKVTLVSDHIVLEDALVSPSPVNGNPRFYVGGASPSALGLAGRQADALSMWIQPLEATSALIERTIEQFEDAGRDPIFALRTHLIVRDTEEDAWAAADELMSKAEPLVQEQRGNLTTGSSMVGVRAQTASYQDHRIGERLWNGISTVRVNCGTAIVGTPDQVANELRAYWDLGIDEFILSGYPHVEEAHRIANDVLPLARQRMT
ncbi:MAG: LLM class flavin-dependent oxidoreductase [Chloroflexi bacterium]|nr:LLM class flavin-dependent oxidoreductase [Chloroflexota bacterium]